MSLPIFAVSDLHLATGNPSKRMDEFGPVWANHPKPLFANWRAEVPEDALVLCPGDLSWGKRLDEILLDWQLIDRQPGKTILCSPGNHDFTIFRSTPYARRNAAHLKKLVPVKFGAERFQATPSGAGVVVACARGSLAPNDNWFAGGPNNPEKVAEAAKEYERELLRLEAALDEARALRQDGDALIVAVHYPPFANLTEGCAYSELIEAAGADICVFGHLHNTAEHERVFQGVRGGVHYALVGCDALGMHPLKLGEMTDEGLKLALSPVETVESQAA